MAYESDYTADDVTSASIDGIVIFIVTLVGFAGIFALILVYKWGKKSVK